MRTPSNLRALWRWSRIHILWARPIGCDICGKHSNISRPVPACCSGPANRFSTGIGANFRSKQPRRRGDFVAQHGFAQSLPLDNKNRNKVLTALRVRIYTFAPQDANLKIRVNRRSVLSGPGVETKFYGEPTYEEQEVVCIARVGTRGTCPVRHCVCAEIRP